MNVIKLSPIGLCPNATKMLELVYNLRNENKDTDIYILGNLLHNQVIINELASNNINTIEYNDETYAKLDKISSDSIVVFAAHGHKKEYLDYLIKRNIKYYDQTCLVIQKIHTFINYFKNANLVYVGKANHDETIAALDLNKNMFFYDIKGKNDLTKLDNKVVYITNQTTVSVEQLDRAVNDIKKHSREVIVNNSICGNVLKRIELLGTIPNSNNTILVIGDEKSANTDYIYNKAKSSHSLSKVYKVNSIEALKDLELINDIYLVSGTSALNKTIDEIEEYLKSK